MLKAASCHSCPLGSFCPQVWPSWTGSSWPPSPPRRSPNPPSPGPTTMVVVVVVVVVLCRRMLPPGLRSHLLRRSRRKTVGSMPAASTFPVCLFAQSAILCPRGTVHTAARCIPVPRSQQHAMLSIAANCLGVVPQASLELAFRTCSGARTGAAAGGASSPPHPQPLGGGRSSDAANSSPLGEGRTVDDHHDRQCHDRRHTLSLQPQCWLQPSCSPSPWRPPPLPMAAMAGGLTVSNGIARLHAVDSATGIATATARTAATRTRPPCHRPGPGSSKPSDGRSRCCDAAFPCTSAAVLPKTNAFACGAAGATPPHRSRARLRRCDPDRSGCGAPAPSTPAHARTHTHAHEHARTHTPSTGRRLFLPLSRPSPSV